MKHMGGIQKNIQFLILGTVIVVPFVFVPITQMHDYFYYPKFIVLLCICIGLIVLLLINYKEIQTLFRFDVINKLLFIYFILITLSLFFSIDINRSIFGKTLRYDGYVTQLIYLLLFLLARNIRVIDRKFIYLVAVSSSLLSIYGIIQYFGLDPFIRDLTRKDWTSVFSTFGNQNFFGSYLVLQIPFSLYGVLFLRTKWAYLSYGLSLLALLMTMTRGAWIAFIAQIILMIILIIVYHKEILEQNKNIVGLILQSILIGVGFNVYNGNQFINRFYTMVNDSNTLLSTSYSEQPEVIERLGSVRVFIWIKAIELIKKRPIFGFGVENLHIAFNQYYKNDIVRIMGCLTHIDKAHNDLLHIAVSSGIPSLGAYVTFFMKVIKNAHHRLKDAINILLLTSVIGYFTCLIFNISVVSVAYIYWTYLGLLCSYDK